MQTAPTDLQWLLPILIFAGLIFTLFLFSVKHAKNWTPAKKRGFTLVVFFTIFVICQGTKCKNWADWLAPVPETLRTHRIHLGDLRNKLITFCFSRFLPPNFSTNNPNVIDVV